MNRVARRILAAALGTGAALSAAFGPAAAAQAAPMTIGARMASVSSVAAAPSAYTLKVTGHRQETNYYCVPASSQLVLNSFGITVSQRTLATKMGTTASGGTSGANANKVLNAYVNPKGYKVVTYSAKDPAKLMTMIRYDVGTLHRAPYMGVWMEDLPWNKGKVQGNNIGHGIAVYGYNASKGTVTVYDPWKPTGGPHTLTVKQLSAVSQSSGGLHYITRT